MFKKNDNAKNKDYLKNRGLAGQFPDGEEEAAVTFQDNAFLKFYGYGERVSYVGRNYTAVNPTSSTEKLSSDISEISAGQTIKLDTSKTENNWSNW